jgi:hypothetical protein
MGHEALKPIGITDDLCRLFSDSGCSYINLAVESVLPGSAKKGTVLNEKMESYIDQGEAQ